MILQMKTQRNECLLIMKIIIIITQLKRAVLSMTSLTCGRDAPRLRIERFGSPPSCLQDPPLQLNSNCQTNMPPRNASANGTTRKVPQFKPPRPFTASAKAPTAAASRAAGVSKKTNATAARPGFQAAATVILSEEEDALEDEFDALSDDLMEDIPAPKPTRAVEPLTTAHPIPAPLLARLLHENFEEPNTQIQKGAMTLTGRYMEIFVREALARAKHERAMSVRHDGISDGFLQVEDLEKLAPQLVLDF